MVFQIFKVYVKAQPERRSSTSFSKSFWLSHSHFSSWSALAVLVSILVSMFFSWVLQLSHKAARWNNLWPKFWNQIRKEMCFHDILRISLTTLFRTFTSPVLARTGSRLITLYTSCMVGFTFWANNDLNPVFMASVSSSIHCTQFILYE